MNENDILGFDPSQLDAFNKSTTQKFQGNPLIYRTRPDESISEDKIYRATIKVIYNPFNFTQSVLEQQSYAIKDDNGWLTVVSSLTVNDTSCPIFKAWKKCHFANKEDNFNLWRQAAKEEEGGRDLFDKRYARYVTIQVLSDKNHPEQEGKYLFWKLPKSIWDMINAKMNPSKESGKPRIPVMDFLFGRAIDIEVIPGPNDPQHPERKARETKYLGDLSEDVVSCVNPDGSPLLNDEEQDVLDMYVMKLQKIWKEKDPVKRAELEEALKTDSIAIKLREIYGRVLADIKKVCPNLIEELGYKEWDDATKARVQRWIDIVLSGNNPNVEDEVPAAAENIGNESTATVVENNASSADPDFTSTPFSTASDDLPF